MYGLFFLVSDLKAHTNWYLEFDGRGGFTTAYPYDEIVQMINNRPGILPAYRNNFSFPATDVMSAIVDLHHDIMFFLIVIIILVS